MEQNHQSGGGDHGRREQNRPGGGRNKNRNRNRSRSRNNRNNRNRNRGGGGGGGGGGGRRHYRGNRNRRPKAPPKRTFGQKILAVLTFGLLGKPGKKKKRPVSKNKPKPQAGNQPQQAQSKSIRSKKQPILHEVTSGRLYVGNLDYGANEAELEELFKGVGTVVTAEVVTNQRTQQSKGFAFVEMGNIDEAKRAVEILHDQDFMGRKLLVSGAKSEGPRDGADDDDSGSSSDTYTETDAGEEEAA